MATTFALLADVGISEGIEVQILGRASIFVLVWITFGIVFTVGAAMGAERADKAGK